MSEPRLTARKADYALDAIAVAGVRDVETWHIEADRVLLQTVPAEVQAAYERVIERAGDWWYA